MSWIIIEGIDRSGKSSVAELYKKQGYEYVHFQAPEKKFTEPGYAGPSYSDELLDLYMSYDNKDVIFDRSVYGELVWPHVYGRDPQVTDDDLDVLKEFEDRNNVQRILMIDPNKDAHWKRCVENKEPLNVNQFKVASRLYEKLAHEHNFIPRQLHDFQDLELTDRKADSSPEDKEPVTEKQDRNVVDNSEASDKPVRKEVEEPGPAERQEKLETANAINQLLSKRIVRPKGPIFDSIEGEIRTFLDQKLSEIFGTNAEDQIFTNDEVQVLKIFCQRLKQKNQGE